MTHDNAITFAGHSAVFLECAGKRIAIDPWLKGNPTCPQELHSPKGLDTIVLTHGHADHAGDAVRVALETGAALAATYELAMIMIAEGVPQDRVIPMNKGGAVTLGPVSLSLTHAMHSSSFDGKLGTVYAGEACGVIVRSEAWCVYHAGDTALFSDMKILGEQYKPDVALLPIGDRFTMGPKEAATAASWLQCGVAIPIHYATFPLLTGTFDEFSRECSLLGVETLELKPGARRSW
jgi:L-ascorbate metabolism protein UlaG (beta-lactamase superfamily)